MMAEDGLDDQDDDKPAAAAAPDSQGDDSQSVPTLAGSASGKPEKRGRGRPPSENASRKSYYQRKKERERLRLLEESLRERELMEQKSRRDNKGFTGDDEDESVEELDVRGKSGFVDGVVENGVYNDELASGDWLEQVIWESGKLPARMPDTHLILDMNDEDFIFVDVKDKQKEKAKRAFAFIQQQQQ